MLEPNHEYSTRDVKAIHDMHEAWVRCEHSDWLLTSFGQNSATFGWNCNGEFTQYVTITRNQIDFFIGVPPDVIDHFYAGDRS